MRSNRGLSGGRGQYGCGIAEHIVTQMIAEGLSDEQARARIYMVDRFGLLTDDQTNLASFQAPLAQPRSRLAEWGSEQGNVLADGRGVSG